jgi:N12 class adenine-specific DNA methylase/phage/plasmid primase-like uncharacterized protein
MKNTNSTYDWMLVTVRGYDQEKGYVYGNRHPDGKGVIIAKKHSVRRDWVRSLSSEKERTFTPPKSVIAVFGAEVKDENSGFTIASWATPISKDLGQEDVFVTPIKIAPAPKKIKNPKPGDKAVFIDAVVLDQSPIPVRTLNDLQSAAISALKPDGVTSLNLDGSRGFMIRIGHTAPDGSLEAGSWEFFGRRENTPEQTWNFHWNQPTQAGRQQNLLKAVLTAAQQALRDTGSYVEIVGLSRVLINDFGDEKRVHDLASLPNYKTNTGNGVVPSYSLAAITIEKHAGSRIVKQQIPLPRNKVVNHLAGVLGNHVPGISMPVEIKPISDPINTVAPDLSKSVINTGFPLSIEDFINQHGQVNSFEVIGVKDAIDKYKDRIETAVPGITPFRVKGKSAYSFPIRFKRDVEAALSDLAGTQPFYVKDTTLDGRPYVTIGGRIDQEPYRKIASEILTNLGAKPSHGLMVLDENQRASLVSAISRIRPDIINNGTSSQPPSEQASNPVGQVRKDNPPQSNKQAHISFSDWQQSRFGKDPYAMLDYLSGEISAFAEEAGIDWGSAKAAVSFSGPNQRGKLVKTRDVRPLDKGHTGSVAMAAHLHEKQGTQPGDSIVWFKINFFNKKLLKDDVVSFDAYPFLKEEYDRDVDRGIDISNSRANLEEIKKKNEQRQKDAQTRIAQQENEDQQSRNFWAQRLPTMPKEDGKNSYFTSKGILNLLNDLDVRSGTDNRGLYSIIGLYDINDRFVGAQRIYENYWEDDKGRRTNKNFIRGTLFKDDATDLPYGTHRLVGRIDPNQPILFCEGVADSGTDRAATGLPVVICLNKGNLYHVVGLYRQKYPNTRLIIAHDNDIYNKNKGNVGFAAALDAARDHNAEYVGPDFRGLNTETKPTDFNDLEKIAGLDVVRNQIRNVRVPPADPLEFHKLKIQVVGLDNLERQINSAIDEIIANGSHGADDNRLFRMLLLRATLAYGHDDVIEALGERAKNVLASKADQNIEQKEETRFPVSISEREGSGGKKYSLITDRSGTHSEKIESALRKILGEKHLPFNEHLNGWVAPYPVFRLLDCFLHESTGAPQLYIGQSRSKNTGSHFVVRGDFSDATFRDKIEKSIRYALPQYKTTEYGFVIPDSRAVPYIRETLHNYLMPRRDLENQLGVPKPEIPEISHTLLDEAVRMSGQSRGEVVLAHYSLLFQHNRNILNDDDFAFSAIYSRSLKSFSHLEPGLRHEKALIDACQSARVLLDTGVANTVVSDTTIQRLNELVTHLEYIVETQIVENPTREDLSNEERAAFEYAIEQHSIDHDDALKLVLGLKNNIASETKTAFLSSYQEKLIVQQPIASKDVPSPELLANEASIHVEPTTPNVEVLSERDKQYERVGKLLDIVRLTVDKGFDEEELYDHFITQPGSPYYNSETFNDVLYRQDMLFLSSVTDIDGWTPKTINTTSQLFYAVYDDVAKSRISNLESYINAYLGANGATTFKTFNKYLSGNQKLSGDISHPYIMEGEVNYDLIAHDLEHLTDLTSIHELYRELSKQFENASLKQNQADIFSGTDVTEESLITGEVISESINDDRRTVVTQYNLQDQPVYGITFDEYVSGRWERLYHNFNIDQSVSLQHAMHLYENGMESTSRDWPELPGGTRGSVSESTLDKKEYNGVSIILKEIDTGPSTFFFIEEKLAFGGTESAVVHGVALGYQQALSKYNSLAEEHKSFIEPEHVDVVDNEVDEQPSVTNPDIENLGQRFKEWAKRGMAVSDVIETLKNDYRMVLEDGAQATIEKQYIKLVAKFEAEEEVRKTKPDERYQALYQKTVEFAKNQTTYDEYLEDFFKPDGTLVERNPYWSDSSQSIDRKSAFSDIKAAGYQSLSQYYEGVFQTINQRKSSDVVLRRVGGFIPDHLDANQPLRPQFQNLESLLYIENGDPDISFIPPFKEWMESPSAFRAVHPILSENLTTADREELLTRYNRDAILLLADIHGAPQLTEPDSGKILDTVLQQWKTRQVIANLSSGELLDLDTSTLTDLLMHLSLPVGGSQKERCDRIIGHIDTLRMTSRLRLAQYSYIGAAINYENVHNSVPNYAYRAINEFINNEVTFKDCIQSTIDDAETATLRKSIERSIALLSSITPIERTLANAQEGNSLQIVGIDQSKQSAMVYSDNYDKTKSALARYQFRYLLPKDLQAREVSLPSEITHHAIISDRVIGTASAIDIDRLNLQMIRPISDAAILSVAKPIERWIEKNGYGCFNTHSGESVVVISAGSQWISHIIDASGMKEGVPHKSVKDFIKTNSDVIDGFIDRDPVIENWISISDERIQDTLDTLKNFKSGSATAIIDKPDEFKDAISQEPFSSLIGENADEDLGIQVQLIADRLQRSIYAEAWNSITTSNSNIDKIREAAHLFVEFINPQTSVQAGDATADTFYAMPPVDAIRLYDEYSSSQKTLHSSLFRAIEARFFDRLTVSEKKNIAIEIASGAYESVGHYLHEQSVIEALKDNRPGAKDVADRFYNDVLTDDTFEPNADPDSAVNINDLVLYVDKHGDEYLFGKVVNVTENDIGLESIPLDILVSNRRDWQGDTTEETSILSFKEYQRKPESLVAPESYLNIDPSSESGLSQLSQIPYKELSDYASVLGANHTGDRIAILSSIETVVQAKRLAAEVEANPNREIKTAEKEIIERAIGPVSNDSQLRESLGSWYQNRQNLTSLEIARRNYAVYTNSSSILTAIESQSIKTVQDKESIFPVFELPTPNMICSELSDVRDIAGFTNSDDHRETVIGYGALALMSMSKAELESLLETIDPDKRVSPVILNGSLHWSVSHRNSAIYNEQTFASVVAAIRAPLFITNQYQLIEGDQVAWISSEGIETGHVAGNCNANVALVPVATSDQNGHAFVRELSISELYRVDENEIQGRFEAILSTITGASDSIVASFKELLEDSTGLTHKDLLETQLIISKAEAHAEEIRRQSHNLPDGYTIHQNGLNYMISATGVNQVVSLNTAESYESLSDLVRNATIQQRLLPIEESSYGALKSPSNPTQSVGNDSSESHGNVSSKPEPVSDRERHMDANVVSISGADRGSNGNTDDSPDDPPSGPGNGGLPRARRSSPADSPAGTRNGSSGGSPRTRGIGFHLPNDLETMVSGGPEHRLRLNLEALKLRRELIDANRTASSDEKLILAKYTGWGGLPSIFSSQSGYNKDRSALFNYLKDGEYDQLKRSVLTAFYTPPTLSRAIWSAIERFGFQEGTVLDPSTGTGQFIGSTPQHISQYSSFVGREIEPVSADIARLLYGTERIHQEPFEKSKLPDNYFDISISNIPFGDIQIFDPDYKKYNFKIHDYFFAKALDKTKPGGIVAFITSTGTLDKRDPSVRQHLYKSADLIGAIRLPRKTFKEYAGTDVSADIIFLQKRALNTAPGNGSWVWSIEQEFPILGRDEYADLPLNRYFIDNPNMIVGKTVAVYGRHGTELVTAYNGEQPIADEVYDRIKNLPSNIFMYHQSTESSEKNEASIPESKRINIDSLKPGNYVVTQGGIGIIDPAFIEETGRYENTVRSVHIPESKIDLLTGLINIRDSVKSIIALQLNGYTTDQLADAQKKLTDQYDRFVHAYGYLNERSNRRLFSSDPDSALLLALERPSNDGTYQKTDIFEKATIRDLRVPTSADSPTDALNISLGVKGYVDTQYISSLSGQAWNEIVNDLGDSIYLDPKTNQWQPREQYLSGNIREKIEYAEHAADIDSGYSRNVDALKEVMPDPIPSYDIRVRLGATWIPEDDIAKFVEHIVAGNNGNFRPQEEFSVSQHAATWVVKVNDWQLSVNEGRVTQDWGTKRVGAHELIEKLLNNRQISVKDRLDDGSYVINRDETIAANQKADTIANEFRSWLWSDPDRTKRLESLYNNRYNVFVEPKYTGNTVRLEGITPSLRGKPLEPRDSQRSAIQRYIFEGRSLNAHPVGSGKTLELVGSAMEGKRLGIHKKPLIVVPNNILSQFGRMALELYPGANALVIDPKQLSKNARKEFTGRIATGNWDMVVIAQSSFNKLATPVEHQKSVIMDERYQLQEALSELSTRENRAAQLTIKRLERALDSLEKKIEALSDTDNKDNFLYLNEIGVDALFVDEADNFLNLYTPTQMGHVPGVNTSASQQAMNMLMAVRYIQELNGNYRGVIFATGTDIRNSMSDMYTMLRYLGPDVLEATGANNFDSFMGTFGEVVKTIEVTPEGSGYRENSRLSKFTNIPEMVMMYRQIADVLTEKEMQLPKPKVDEINVAADPSDWLKMYMAHLAARAKETRSGGISNRDDNLLKIASDGRKASLDMRLVDSRIPDDPASKVNQCVNNVFSEWEDGNDKRLTQIVFCDLGVPNNKKSFSVYEDIKEKLILRGIPEAEIAFAQNYKTDVKKKELENAINNGDIRVVIASTETLGVGSNVQERLIAQHNLDAPWRPRDLEQRGGRMERPGNINEVTRRYNYSTIDSFDLFMWETLKRKAAFIMQAKTDPKSAAREIEEDLNPTYSEIMSITTGNPLIRTKIEIDSNVERLQSSERSHRRAQWDNRNRINTHYSQISYLKDFINENQKLLSATGANDGKLIIQGKIYDDTKKAAAAINNIVKMETENKAYKPVTQVQLGQLGELPIKLAYMAASGRWVMQAGEETPKTVSDHKSIRAMVESLMTFSNILDREVRRCERDINRHESAIHSLQDSASKPFEQKDELDALLDKQREVNAELANAANEDIEDKNQELNNFEEELEKLDQQAARMRVG